MHQETDYKKTNKSSPRTPFTPHQKTDYIKTNESSLVWVSGEDSFVLIYVVCPLVHPEKGPRGRLVFLGIYWGARGRLVCLHVVYLLVFLKRLQGKTCQWGLSRVWGKVMHK